MTICEFANGLEVIFRQRVGEDLDLPRLCNPDKLIDSGNVRAILIFLQYIYLTHFPQPHVPYEKFTGDLLDIGLTFEYLQRLFAFKDSIDTGEPVETDFDHVRQCDNCRLSFTLFIGQVIFLLDHEIIPVRQKIFNLLDIVSKEQRAFIDERIDNAYTTHTRHWHRRFIMEALIPTIIRNDLKPLADKKIEELLSIFMSGGFDEGRCWN